MLVVLLWAACAGDDPQAKRGPVDADRDGFPVPADCDDDDPAIHPEAVEACDGIDQNCDERIDEEVPEPTVPVCETGGVCGDGWEARCSDGVWACTYASEAWEPVESACDGADNDCDGQVDEGVVAPASFTCTGLGVCGEGATPTCAGGAWECVWSSVEWEPDETTCDGLDNDCDGATDESLVPPADVTCLTDGVCADGASVTCASGAWECGYVSSLFEAVEVTCDGVDNDCDGIGDEELTAPVDFACDPDGVCAAGATPICGDGTWSCLYASAAWEPAEQTCDGLDNDCDGQVDEDLVAPPAVCDPDGVCADDQLAVCTGVAGWACEYGSEWWESVESSCDQRDNDCDAVVDEGLAADCSALACGPDPVCGESCGTCGAGFGCVAGACVEVEAWWSVVYSDYQVKTQGSTATPDGGVLVSGYIEYATPYWIESNASPPVQLGTATGLDGLTLRFEPTGEVRFAVQVGLGGGSADTFDAAELSDGRTAIVGDFVEDTTIGTTSAAPLPLAGVAWDGFWHADGFLAVLDAQGVPVWATAFGDTQPPFHTETHGLQVTGLPDGAIAVLAESVGPVTFAVGTPEQVTVPRPGAREVFAAVFEPDGQLRWTSSLVDQTDVPTQLALGPDGLLHVLVQGFNNASWVSVDPLDGSVVRTVAIGTDFYTWPTDLAFGAAGEAYLVGNNADDTLGIGEPNETDIGAGGFVARYAADGTLDWARTATWTRPGVGVGADGRVSVIGTTTRAPAVLDSGAVVPVEALYELGDSTNDDEILLSRWTPDGGFEEYAFVVASEGSYAYKEPRVYPQPDGTAIIAGYVYEEALLLVPAGPVAIGFSSDTRMFVARDDW
jgi:hypothetical protein